jgi:thiol-disulfide isomerase/thioredoxin
LAAQRAVAAASGASSARRRRLLLVIAPIVVVVAVVAIFVAVKVGSGSSGPKSGTAATSAAAQVITQVTSVPPSVLDTIGKGTVSTPPTALTGAALTADGKPRILYVGAEWCPYCAAERWSLAVALSRFGTLTGLGEVSSSPTDAFPNTATLSFHGASYTSTYLSLTAKEIYSNQVSGGNYAPLDTLDAADNALFTGTGKGSFPFIDIGGKYMISGASYDPTVLKGKTQAQIAAALSDPTSPIAQAVGGTANMITAAICQSTAAKPAAVCSSAGVKAASSLLPAAASKS